MRMLISIFLLTVSPVIVAESNQINLSKEQIYNLGVKIGQLEKIDHIPLLSAPAQVVVPPNQEHVVSASQAGLISKLCAATGDRVEKGQILANIKSPDLIALQRQFLKAGNERRLAWLSYRRDQKLHEEGVIADRRWQETRSLYSSSTSELNEARQLLEIAGMSDSDINTLQKSRRLTSQLSVRSPIDGIVLERMVAVGERLNMLEPMYRIANLEQLWLEISIPQERIHLISKGDQVALENSDVSATVSLMNQSVNFQDQTVLARAVLASGLQQIRAGQKVNVQIIQNSTVPAYRVPNGAVAQSGGGSYIFVRNPDGFAVTPVTVIGKLDTESVVKGELTGLEKIAVRGAVALKANWLGLGEDE